MKGLALYPLSMVLHNVFKKMQFTNIDNFFSEQRVLPKELKDEYFVLQNLINFRLCTIFSIVSSTVICTVIDDMGELYVKWYVPIILRTHLSFFVVT